MTNDKYQKFIDHTIRDQATERLSDLLIWLNANNIRTDVGAPYSSPRGVARLVAAAWVQAGSLNDPAMADRIATRYVDRNYRYPYE